MVTATLQLLILLNSLRLITGLSPDCDDSWKYLEDYNSCLGVDPEWKSRANWPYASSKCEKKNQGQLVVIKTEKKEDFVRAARPDPYAYTWIGASDRNQDGQFVYADGSYVLPYPTKGLGDWGSNVTREGNCVSLGPNKEKWRIKNCFTDEAYMCEFKLKKCCCKKQAWAYSSNGNNKYRAVFAHPRKHKYAVEVCEGFGGNLVTIHDAADSLKELNVTKANDGLYWMGLVRDNLKNNHWRWVDGTPLTKDDYQKWSRPAGAREKCASIKVSTGKWVPRFCEESEALMSICEATNPCALRPTITVQAGRILENTTVVVTTRKALVIKCFSNAGSDEIKSMELSCEFDQEILAPDSGSPWTYPTVDVNMHRKKCFCQATPIEGKRELNWVEISFQTNPFLRNKTDSVPTFVGKEGRDVLVSFDAFINPDVKTVELSKNGSVVVNNGVYNYSVTAINDTIYSSVELVVLKVRPNDTGIYFLSMKNGMKEPLEFSFRLNVTKKDWKNDDKGGLSNTTLILIAGLSVALILALCLIFFVVWQALLGQLRQENEGVDFEDQVEDFDDTAGDFVPTATRRVGQSTIIN